MCLQLTKSTQYHHSTHKTQKIETYTKYLIHYCFGTNTDMCFKGLFYTLFTHKHGGYSPILLPRPSTLDTLLYTQYYRVLAQMAYYSHSSLHLKSQPRGASFKAISAYI